MIAETGRTRYLMVRDILDKAAGKSAAAYGGVGRFWNLPREEFLEVTVQGQRMIAPAAEDSGSNPGRGDSSALVIGLRGLAPFDGSQFPPLPWGGTPVASADIGFISDWIDDGCPFDDHLIESLPLSTTSENSLSLFVLQPEDLQPPARTTFEAIKELGQRIPRSRRRTEAEGEHRLPVAVGTGSIPRRLP